MYWLNSLSFVTQRIEIDSFFNCIPILLAYLHLYLILTQYVKKQFFEFYHFLQFLRDLNFSLFWNFCQIIFRTHKHIKIESVGLQEVITCSSFFLSSLYVLVAFLNLIFEVFFTLFGYIISTYECLVSVLHTPTCWIQPPATSWEERLPHLYWTSREYK